MVDHLDFSRVVRGEGDGEIQTMQHLLYLADDLRMDRFQGVLALVGFLKGSMQSAEQHCRTFKDNVVPYVAEA
jgi:hypothetical protein